MDKAFVSAKMKKQAKTSPQTARLRSNSGEKMQIPEQPRVDISPVLGPYLSPDLIFDRDFAHGNVEMKVGKRSKQPGVDDPRVPSGDIPPCLSPLPLHPDSAADENGGGGSGNINVKYIHTVAQRDGNEDSETLTLNRDFAHGSVEMKVGKRSKQPGVDDPRVPSGDISPCLSPPPLHPDSVADENGGGGSGNINEKKIHHVGQRDGNEDTGIYCRIRVWLFVGVVALVAVMTGLWLTGKFSQGGITTPLTIPIPTISQPKPRITLTPTPGPTFKNTSSPTLRLMLRPELKLTIRPTARSTLRPTLRPSLSPTECFAQTPLLQLTADHAKDGDNFGESVSVFDDWAIVGVPNSDNYKDRAYLYRKDTGAWKEHQELQASDGSEGDLFGNDDDDYDYDYFCCADLFGQSVAIHEKNMVIGAPGKDNGNGPNEGAVYTFMLQGDTWMEHAKVFASDGAYHDYFGYSVAISGDTLLVGAPLKDDYGGGAYVFVLAGDGSWDEGTRLIPRNGIAPGDYFGYAVALSGDRALIGAHFSDESGDDSGAAYIFHRMNGVWQEEAKLVPADGASYYAFGYDVSLSGDTSYPNA